MYFEKPIIIFHFQTDINLFIFVYKNENVTFNFWENFSTDFDLELELDGH